MGKRAYTYDGSDWVGLTSTTADLSNYANMTNTPISGFRNAIINGDFRINQRGFTSKGAAGIADYGFDRWFIFSSEGNGVLTPQTFTLGNAISGYEPQNFMRLDSPSTTKTTASESIGQRIEDVRTFAGQTITISFWAKAASGTPNISIELSQNFGTGGSPSSQVNTYVDKIPLSTSWTRYTETVTVPSISGKTIGTTANTSYLELRIWCSAGSDFDSRTNSLGNQDNNFDFWGFQVEAGTIATPLEQRPIGTELALCQRYYWRWNTNGNSYAYYSMCVMRNATGFTLGTGLKHPVTMRVAPSISFNSMFGEVPSGGGKALANGLVTNNLSTVENVGFIATADSNWGASEPGFVRANTTTAAYVEHSAEL